MTPAWLRDRLERWGGPAFLLAAAALVLGPHAPWAGLHLDDYGFHASLANADSAGMWTHFWRYVPGRNLHILYTWLFYKAFGPSPFGLHLAGLAVDAANVWLAWLLARKLGADRGEALLIGGLFLVFPNHGETHFWTSAIAMNLLSTTLILAAALAACSGKPLFSLALFALALFDYDQVFLMWIPLLLCLRRAPKSKLGPVRAGQDEAGQRPRPAEGWLFSGLAMALCVAHVAIRHGSPDGSNPTIRLGSIALRAAQAAVSTALPMMRLPRWGTLHSFVGGPPATAVLVAALAAAWIWCVRRLWTRDDGARSARSSLAAVGVAWWAAAYFPNLFWFISPRHHYLPSLGALFVLPLGLRAILARRPRSAAALAAAGAAFFALSSAQTLGQGWSWKTAWQLMERFSSQAPALVGPAPEGLFLHAAPLRVGYAPAFALTSEHASAYAERVGRQPRSYGVTLAPTRGGLFWMNYPQLFGDSYFSWQALPGARVVVYGPEGALSCARAMRLELPDGRVDRLPLAGRRDCAAEPRVRVPVWLRSSRVVRARGAPLAALSGGPILRALAVQAHPGKVLLTLVWDGPAGRDFAAILRLYGDDGRLLYRPAYRERPGDAASAELSWPLLDDVHPRSSWRRGSAVESAFELVLEKPLPAGPAQARLELFERNDDGPWTRLGELHVGLRL